MIVVVFVFVVDVTVIVAVVGGVSLVTGLLSWFSTSSGSHDRRGGADLALTWRRRHDRPVGADVALTWIGEVVLTWCWRRVFLRMTSYLGSEKYPIFPLIDVISLSSLCRDLASSPPSYYYPHLVTLPLFSPPPAPPHPFPPHLTQN